ncbi:MAG: hypothetical protein AAGA67_02695 [Cyanobacteria bacterium P01_F01_bin.153]
MMSPEPDFPHKVLSFPYRSWTLEITQGQVDDQTVFSVWASHDLVSAIAVPRATSREQAIRWGKRYVDKRLNPGGPQYQF